MTNVQISIEQQRAVYDAMPRPLLSQLCEIHGISVRDFAEIFGVSKSYAGELLNHQKLPPLDLAVRISRYWEVRVEELFGWRVDDDGARRPLLIAIPGTGRVVRLVSQNKDHGALVLVKAVAESVATGKDLLEFPGIWRESSNRKTFRKKKAQKAEV